MSDYLSPGEFMDLLKENDVSTAEEATLLAGIWGLEPLDVYSDSFTVVLIGQRGLPYRFYVTCGYKISIPYIHDGYVVSRRYD